MAIATMWPSVLNSCSVLENLHISLLTIRKKVITVHLLTEILPYRQDGLGL